MSNSQDVKDPIREEILNGARELFERFGFKKTTMEDIARQIGKSKSSLYYYYKTKEEIFEAMVLNDMDQQFKIVAALVEQEASAYKRFIVLYTTMFADVKLKAKKFSIFRTDLFENHFFIDGILKKRDYRIEELLKNILILGISQQEVKMMSSADMNLWAQLINTSMKAIGNKIFMEDDFIVTETQIQFMADALFNGVKA